MNEIMNKIMVDIEGTFGSVKSPNWSLIAKRQEDIRIAQLIDELKKTFVVKDYTDLNYSSEIDLLLGLGERYWSLELSLVGDYALLKKNEEGTWVFVDEPKDGNDEQIFRAVGEIKPSLFLGSSILEEKILFNFASEGDKTEMVDIYRVLFAEDGISDKVTKPH